MLPDGRTFTNAEDFKQLLLADRKRFLEAFVKHLCTYGLRRVLTIDDQSDIRSIVDAAIEKEYRLQDILRVVVLSDLFQKR